MVSGQAISVTKLEEVENEHLQAGSCSISSTGQDGQPRGQSGGTRGGDKELEKVFWPSVGAFLETK